MLQALKRGSLAVLSFWTVLLLTLSFTTVAQEKENSVDQTEMTQLAGADFWRQVRAGEAGRSSTAVDLKLYHGGTRKRELCRSNGNDAISRGRFLASSQGR
ncbi:hypothetical protein VVS222_02616 [Vibrio vulnificus]|nr:hypothetical protein VVS222_02616 [Vibrio vulnificus]